MRSEEMSKHQVGKEPAWLQHKKSCEHFEYQSNSDLVCKFAIASRFHSDFRTLRS